MPFSRENTIPVSAASGAGAAVTLKLPNAATTGAPSNIQPIGAGQRWRIRNVIASYSAAPAAGSTLTITDGVFTWTVDVTTAGVVSLSALDVQCAAGAEVDLTLSAGGGSIVAHLNALVVSEG